MSKLHRHKNTCTNKMIVNNYRFVRMTVLGYFKRNIMIMYLLYLKVM